MNKRILVYYSQLNIGGAEKSLIRLMNALVDDGNEVTLLTRYSEGKAEQFLNEKVKKIAFSEPFLNRGLFRKIKSGIQRTVMLLKLKACKQEYDLVIVGLQGLSPACLSGIIKTHKYIQSIRSDLTKTNQNVISTLKKNSNLTDGYMCVSQTAMDSLIATIPAVKDKAFVLYNLLDADTMRIMAEQAENPFIGEEAFKIVSVCRVSDKAKGVFRMLDCLEQLIREGYNVKWYLVGNGPDLEALKEQVAAKGLSSRFIMVGNQNNPFGYYRYCDLVAVPSYYEGLCGVVNEAKITGCAVLATEFSGIHEQLTHGQNGWIVDNNTEAIIDGLRILLTNKSLLNKIYNNDYPKEIMDDRLKIDKLYEILMWA